MKREQATYAAGCFWCIEAIFIEIKGIISVMPGYTGGRTQNPSYEEVCSSSTGHAEAVQITFDPEMITYEELLYIFWRIHNPTTKNRQGNDIGSQYRSAIFYHTQEQKEQAEQSMDQAQLLFEDPIVTEITPLTIFYPAEEYHHNYFQKNPNNAYCQIVIEPKMQSLRQELSKFLATHSNPPERKT